MRRGLFLLVFLSLVSALAIWVADRPGRLLIDWQGWRIEASVLALLIGVLGLAILIWWLAKLWVWLRSGHALSPERRALRRHKSGLKDLDDALGAFAAGDYKGAKRHADHAVKRLEESAVARIIAAQAATSNNDPKAAQTHYDALASSERGRLIGLRGQLLEARRKGEVTKALEIAQKAIAKAPKSAWVLTQAFELAAQSLQWEQAQQALNVALRQGAFSKEEAARHRAALYYAQAVELEHQGSDAKALQFALKAQKSAPDFQPAVVLAARLHRAAGQIRKAGKLIEVGWKSAPHPSLADVYAVLKPTENAQARMKRFETLHGLNPEHRESRLRLAEAAIGCGDLERARKALTPLIDQELSARFARLMLQLLDREQADATARAHWSDLAVKGSAEPLWGCVNCGSERTRWVPHCPNCASFNAFEWDRSKLVSKGISSEDPLKLIASNSH